MDISFVSFAVLGFLAVVLALEGIYNLWASTRSPEAQRVSERLKALGGELHEQVSLERHQQERLPQLEALLGRTGAGKRMRRYVQASASSASAVELILVSAALGALGLALPGLIGQPPVFGVALGLVLAVLPWWRVGRRYRDRVQRFERQFPEALDLMSRALRAGHAFPTAVKMVGDEMPAPLGPEFRVFFDEMNYGVPVNDALVRLAARVPVAEVAYFAVAVMIQRESGGNLAELLDKMSSIVRERLKLLGHIRTLSAEGRLSARILTVLPFAVAFVISVVNPEFMAVLWNDPAGLKVIGVALVLMVLGILWMRKIIRIRV